jgi:hypothetical protein
MSILRLLLWLIYPAILFLATLDEDETSTEPINRDARESPHVSIVMAVRKRGTVIQRTIESLLKLCSSWWYVLGLAWRLAVMQSSTCVPRWFALSSKPPGPFSRQIVHQQLS